MQKHLPFLASQCLLYSVINHAYLYLPEDDFLRRWHILKLVAFQMLTWTAQPEKMNDKLFFLNQFMKKEKYFWRNSYEYFFRWRWSWHVLSRLLFLTENANCPIKFHGMYPTKSEIVDFLFWLTGFAVQNRIPTDSASVISRRYTQFTFISPPLPTAFPSNSLSLSP